MTDLWNGLGLENLFVAVVLIALAVPAGFGAYWLQRRHTLREMEAIAMQERHLYRMLQGFLERDEDAAARDYVAQLLRREEP